MAAKTLYVKLTAQTEAFQRGMKAAADSVDRLTSLLKVAAGAAVAFKAAQALKGLAEEAFKTIDATAKLSDRLGVATETIQGMRLQADLSGVAFETMTGAIDKMRNNIGEAIAGNKGLRESFAALGVSIAELRTLTPEQQFGRIADALNKVEDANTKAKLAQDVFGKSAAELGPLLREGSAGLAAATEDAKRLGLAFDRIEAAKVEMANDAVTRLGAVASGVGQRIAIELSPYITAIAQQIEEASASSDGFKESIRSTLEVGAATAGVFADAWQVLMIGIKSGRVAISTVVETYYELRIAGEFVLGALGDLWNNLVNIVSAVGDKIVADMDVAWSAIKSAAGVVVGFIGEKFATLIRTLGDGLSFFDDELAASAVAAANRIELATAGWRASTLNELDAAVKGAEEAGSKLGEALTHAFDIQDHVDQELDATLEAWQETTQQLQEDLSEAIDAPWKSEAIDAWVQKVQESAQVAAEAIAKTNAPPPLPGPGSVDDGRDAESDARAMRDQDELEALREKLMTEQELEDKQHYERLNKIAELSQSDEDENQLTERENQRHADVIAKQEKALRDQRIATAANAFSNLSQLMNSHSKKAFEIGKAAAIAETTINTAQAAMAAYKAMAGIPVVGPALGAAAAAAAVAAGLVQIQNIRSTSFGGGGSPAASGGGGSPASIAGGGNFGPAGVQGAGGGGQRINLTLNGSMFSAEQVRDLIDQINEAQSDGKRVA